MYKSIPFKYPWYRMKLTSNEKFSLLNSVMKTMTYKMDLN